MSPTIARVPTLVLSAVLAGAVWAPAAAADCPSRLQLAEDEDVRECTDENIVEWMRRSGLKRPYYDDPSGVGFVRRGPEYAITGSGPIEVVFILREKAADEMEGGFELAVTDELKLTSSSRRVGTMYRMLLRDPEEFILGAHYFVWGPNPEYASLYELDHDFDLRIILRRVTRTCSMWASVSGDVNDTYYGDVAYYNFAVDGMFVDPDLIRLMGVDPDAEPEGGDSFSAFIKKETRATGNFALSLRDFKLDQEFDTLSEGGDAVAAMLGIGDPKDQEVVRQVVGMLNNQFALSMAAAVDSLPKPGSGAEKSEESGKKPRGKPVRITLTGVTATVGAVASGGRIPFELVPGTPSAATLLLAVDGPRDLVYGTFLGDLYTKKAYTLPAVPDARQLHVHVEANFTALEGQNTCVMAKQPH
jgi:hypothetical protein